MRGWPICWESGLAITHPGPIDYVGSILLLRQNQTIRGAFHFNPKREVKITKVFECKFFIQILE
jgi:hypothetical protein